MPPPERPHPESFSVFTHQMKTTYRCAERWRIAAHIARVKGIGNIGVQYEAENPDPKSIVDVTLTFNSAKTMEAWNTICSALMAGRKQIELTQKEFMEPLSRTARARIWTTHIKSALRRIHTSSSHEGSGIDYE